MPTPLTVRELADSSGPVKLVQVTDTHLGELPGSRLLDMDTDHSLQAVLAQLRQQRPDNRLLLATGDLSDQGAPQSYERLVNYLAPLGTPAFALPGNHDDLENLRAVCGDILELEPLVRVGPWQIIMLNSQIPGKVGGELGTDQLVLLQAALDEGAELGLYSLVCLHHQPIPIGCAWLDDQMITDADQLFDILDRDQRVRGLLWGHVHQARDESRGSLHLMSTPSTCVQFAPNSDRFRADSLPPGYRWLELHPDGRIDTGVERLQGVELTVDLDSSGYL